MKILFVLDRLPPCVGGAENQAETLAEALEKRGHIVAFHGRRFSGILRFTLRLWREAPFYDVFHAHLAGGHALIAAMVGRLRGVPVVVKLGGGPGVSELSPSMQKPIWALKLRLLKWLRPTFVAVSDEVAAEAKARLGVECVVIPNGVDLERFRQLEDK